MSLIANVKNQMSVSLQLTSKSGSTRHRLDFDYIIKQKNYTFTPKMHDNLLEIFFFFNLVQL